MTHFTGDLVMKWTSLVDTALVPLMNDEVRQPVICCNNHVFCSNCIKVWLEKSSQCPTCRVAITPENPCREIIGATTDFESSESDSVKRRLRKTRGELLLREYEDEIETLLKENEDLKSKNLSLEMQLKTAVEPSTVLVPQSESSTVDSSALEESANKLRAANDLYRKVKQDLERLKEANKTLRSQIFDLIQENMRLKAEVDSRSPQKFGRYTVAALEAKIHQYERDVAQLKRALERSDKYIEELEAQNQRDGPKSEESVCSNAASGGTQNGGIERIALMRRSLSEMEETSVCTDLDRKCSELPNNHGCLLTTSDVCQRVGFLGGTLTPRNDGLKDITVPSTPSSALRSLSLKSPAAVCSDRKLGLKPLTYLRRLSFDDCQGPTSSSSVNQSPGSFQVNKGAPFGEKTTVNLNKEVLCGGWMDCGPDLPRLDENREEFKRSKDPVGNSEACMDAAYLDKISELDSMMAEGESSSSRVSHLPLASSSSSQSPDFDATQIPELDFCSNLLADPGTAREHQTASLTQETTHCDAATASEEEASVVEFSDRAGVMVENPTQPTKRKCPPGLTISSPSKLSKLK
ncbi:RING finger protein 219 isoform X1 [Sinocyclocheilus anshuiensis]|uniref:RING finger protein 219-like n=1 Tax=Sinocyclocheilus anshuiensis TaxID=1608454 RepID=A0A671NNL0_9TELE|nr:PREDICTED: RING finger protein 219-like isoform X1 [Sinocyclocheilus anshuiensis]